MGRYPERDRGVMLKVLDLSEVEAEATEMYRKEKGDPDGRIEAGWTPWGVAEKDGKLYVVCNEGVGYEVTDEEPLVVDLYRRAEGSMTIFPTMQANLAPDDVRRFTTDEEIDLADLVRTFGQRLEDNFGLWYSVLGGA